jgi:hypothetical protein
MYNSKKSHLTFNMTSSIQLKIRINDRVNRNPQPVTDELNLYNVLNHFGFANQAIFHIR